MVTFSIMKSLSALFLAKESKWQILVWRHSFFWCLLLQLLSGEAHFHRSRSRSHSSAAKDPNSVEGKKKECHNELCRLQQGEMHKMDLLYYEKEETEIFLTFYPNSLICQIGCITLNRIPRNAQDLSSLRVRNSFKCFLYCNFVGSTRDVFGNFLSLFGH